MLQRPGGKVNNVTEKHKIQKKKQVNNSKHATKGNQINKHT